MQQNRSLVRRVGIDILGYGCIILAGLTGWLPGPGGIPLLIVGLSLLATNHQWAERLLLWLKNRGGKIADTLFDGHPLLKLFIDLLGILFITMSAYALTQLTGNIIHSAAISLLVVSIVLLLGNRKRFHRLKSYFRK